MQNTQYKVPSNMIGDTYRRVPKDEILKWFTTARQTGEAHLETQLGYRLAEKCLKVLLNEDVIKQPTGEDGDALSKLYINRVAKVTHEAIANQSNIRPSWQFLAADREDEKQSQDAELFNKKFNYDWNTQGYQRALVSVLQWAAPAGTGYIGLCPKQDVFGDCTWRIVPEVYDYKSVMVGHIEKSNDLNDAYYTIIKKEMPLPTFHRLYPRYRDYTTIQDGIPSWMMRGIKQAAKKIYGIFELGSMRRGAQLDNPFPMVNLYEVYIKDDTINTTGKDILVGDEGADSSRVVPSYYDQYGEITQVETGAYESVASDTDPSGQEKIPIKRDIERYECMLFSNMRQLIIANNDAVIYDGPNKYWIKHPPVVPFYFLRWVGEFLGIPFIAAAISPQRELNRLLRALIDAVIGKISPALAIDESIPDPVAKKLNPRTAIGKYIKIPIRMLKDAITTILPADYYNIDGRAFELIRFLIESIDYVLSSNDMSMALKLRQTPAADTQEKLLESMGAIPTFINRGIEESLIKLGELWKDLEFQWSTTKETIRIFGADAIPYTTLDYDPQSIVPLKDENDPRPRWKRAREYAKKFTFYVVPDSLHEKNSITHKLEGLQMKNVGIEISNEELYNMFRPHGSFKVTRAKYFQEQEDKLLFAVEMQNKAKVLSQAPPSNDTLNMAVGMLNGDSNKVGRPSSNQAPPQLEQKKTEDGIPRSTVTTN